MSSTKLNIEHPESKTFLYFNGIPIQWKAAIKSTPSIDNGQRLIAFTVICVVKTKKKKKDFTNNNLNAGIWNK